MSISRRDVIRQTPVIALGASTALLPTPTAAASTHATAPLTILTSADWFKIVDALCDRLYDGEPLPYDDDLCLNSLVLHFLHGDTIIGSVPIHFYKDGSVKPYMTTILAACKDVFKETKNVKIFTREAFPDFYRVLEPNCCACKRQNFAVAEEVANRLADKVMGHV